MEEMRRIAFETVQRACLFGSLDIFCVMVGMSFEPRLAFQAGGTLTVLMALILLYKAREALRKDYRRTEMWLYLPKDFRRDRAADHLGDRDRDVGDSAFVRVRGRLIGDGTVVASPTKPLCAHERRGRVGAGAALFKRRQIID